MKKLSFGLLFLVSSPLYATSFREVSEEDRIASADYICAAEILAVTPEKSKNAVRSLAQVKLLDCAKGNIRENQIQVVWPGGTSGRTRTLIPGVDYLQVGEKGVLYLGKDKANNFFHLKAWQIERLQSSGDDLVFDEPTPFRSRDRREQVDRRTWSSFKQKVQRLNN